MAYKIVDEILFMWKRKYIQNRHFLGLMKNVDKLKCYMKTLEDIGLVYQVRLSIIGVNDKTLIKNLSWYNKTF